jgi:hypothetical protein
MTRTSHLPLSVLDYNFCFVHLHRILDKWSRRPQWSYDDVIQAVQQSGKDKELISHLVSLLERDENGSRYLSQYIARYQGPEGRVPQEVYDRASATFVPWSLEGYSNTHKIIKRAVSHQFAALVDEYSFIVRSEALKPDRDIDRHVVDDTYKTIYNLVVTHLKPPVLVDIQSNHHEYLKWLLWAYMDILRYLHLDAGNDKAELFGEFNEKEEKIKFNASNWSFY